MVQDMFRLSNIRHLKDIFRESSSSTFMFLFGFILEGGNKFLNGVSGGVLDTGSDTDTVLVLYIGFLTFLIYHFNLLYHKMVLELQYNFQLPDPWYL